MTNTSDIPRAFLRGVPPDLPALGLAVSGGSDSLAMMYAAHAAFAGTGTRLAVATVDHSLRDGSADEAAGVARAAAALGLDHDILTWGAGDVPGWDGRGNLQDAARRARYALLSEWAARRGLGAVALAHTADDQAETVLMRLARASGVDGLAAMAADSHLNGLRLLRPLLAVRRAELRRYLTALGVDWVDDPSNDNPAFDRIRIRKALETLGELGMSVPALAQVAQHMQSARTALDAQADAAIAALAQSDSGDLLLDRAGLLDLPAETARRVLIRGLRAVTGQNGYPPRGVAIDRLLAAVSEGRNDTQAGCRLLVRRDRVRLCREYAAVRDLRAEPGQAWDGRWRLIGPAENDTHVAALGPEGARQCPDWRVTGRPHASVIATPAVWQGQRLIAAPLANLPQGWRAEPAFPSDA